MRSEAESKSRRSWRRDAAFAAFVVAQVSDGLFTYMGVRAFGIHIEANPLIAWYVAALGPGVALAAIKVVAVTCGAVLHHNAMHRTLGALTVVYAVVALWSWTRLFAAIL